MERLRRLRRVAARGVGRLFQASIRPALTHGSEVHGLSPNENRRVERIATAALAPASGGIAHCKINMAWGALAPRTHRGHAPALFGAMGFNARRRSGPACFRTSFAADGMGGRTPFEGGWRDAVGPIHIAVLEARRAGFDAIAGFALRRGGDTLQLIRDSAALI